jgi:hypothetical protein
MAEWPIDLRTQLFEQSLDISALWCRILEIYTGLSLTNFADNRLVAVAGIAKEINSMLTAEAPRNPRPVYVSGWWLHDIHVGLLREHKTVEPNAQDFEIKDIPTWSWARWPGPVHWRSKGSSAEPDFELSRVMLRNEYQTGTEDEEPTKLGFGNRFACLVLRGKLSLVLVRDFLHQYPDDTAAKLARYTGVPGEDTQWWRAIVRPGDSRHLVGWISLDTQIRSQTWSDLLSTEKPVVQVLHVSTQKGVPGGLGFGRMTAPMGNGTHDAYSFLAAMSTMDEYWKPGRYRRVVIGRNFEQDFFEAAEEFMLEVAQS